MPKKPAAVPMDPGRRAGLDPEEPLGLKRRKRWALLGFARELRAFGNVGASHNCPESFRFSPQVQPTTTRHMTPPPCSPALLSPPSETSVLPLLQYQCITHLSDSAPGLHLYLWHRDAQLQVAQTYLTRRQHLSRVDLCCFCAFHCPIPVAKSARIGRRGARTSLYPQKAAPRIPRPTSHRLQLCWDPRN